jgi:hypothetical protein
MPLGRFIVAAGTVPGGSDAEKLFPLFSAAAKPVEIHFIQYWGGDTSEYVQMILVPPTVVLNGTTGVIDHPGTIAIVPGRYMGDTVYTQASPEGLGSNNGGRGAPRFTKFVVPPNYQIGIQASAANTDAWNVTIGGFELDY